MAIVKTDFSIGSDYTTNFYNFLNTYCSSYFDSITQNEYTVTCKRLLSDRTHTTA